MIHSNASASLLSCPFSEALNEEQKLAVQHIVWGQNHSLPMILHGPPGTGKTRTLVAAIAEIVRGTNDFVLVMAHSNLACDEIAIRLLEVLRDGELIRIYAKSIKKEMVNIKIMPICNIRNGKFDFPSLAYLYQFRVVVSTLFTAGGFSRAREEDPAFNSGHFSRIIIDEAGCIHEPTSMIPIAGLYLPLFQNV